MCLRGVIRLRGVIHLRLMRLRNVSLWGDSSRGEIRLRSMCLRLMCLRGVIRLRGEIRLRFMCLRNVSSRLLSRTRPDRNASSKCVFVCGWKSGCPSAHTMQYLIFYSF